MSIFTLKSSYKPQGDQPKAIKDLVRGIGKGFDYQTLLGVTGSGKTFTMACTIAEIGISSLILAPNKTLAAQLCSEFKQYFPDNSVEYFVSYYDYYQPEAYLPQRDMYIEKDSSINEEIDRLRHRATSALLSRNDVIVVASVSCIYNLGSPDEYKKRIVPLKVGEKIERDELLKKLVSVNYERNDFQLKRGGFRVRGDVLEILPSYEEKALRVQFFHDEVEKLVEIDPLTGEIVKTYQQIVIYPATHFVTGDDEIEEAINSIEKELEWQLKKLQKENKIVEAQRLKMRTKYDMEMLREAGYCNGIENYSRHFSGKAPGEFPDTLLNYFQDEFLVFLDESHLAVPQLRGMYEGDKSRKETLVEYGFRLPSALDNRPLTFEEFQKKVHKIVFVSATPGPYELKVSKQVVEQIVRPTGLVDPQIKIRPSKTQIDDLINEIRKRTKKKERVLVTTLTKKTAEDLTDYLLEIGIKARYLHSEIKTLERIVILTNLRKGTFNVLVGINLLREGLDLPEVSLVAILDADREGFLRNERSLIQTMGRAARNVSGMVILYADKITGSINNAVEETKRRREIQLKFNEKHGIKPESIRKAITDIIEATRVGELPGEYLSKKNPKEELLKIPKEEILKIIQALEEEMGEAAGELEFELAAELRDKIAELRQEMT
ncbi:MAG: excinuclease ABC subunit UvrB [Actinomycetia bacterium]|nr:excinuclease ABC subunit UvrB [Actinomycetes bacterium]